jgi:type III pantothenate kinase
MKKPAQKFLLIDVGNSRLKWATAECKGPIKSAGDVSTARVTKSWIHALAKKHQNYSAVMACVVPKLIPALRETFNDRLTVVSARMPIGFAANFGFRYPKPSELGADRIASAIAVCANNFFPAVVIACGTATAFTVVDAKGKFCGGAIAPGLQAQLEALIEATAQLPATKLRMPRTALAKSTRDAISAGVMLNYRGGIKEILAELLKTMPSRPKPSIILTGGNAHLIARNLGPGVKLRPLLVFEGLLMIGSRMGMPATS